MWSLSRTRRSRAAGSGGFFGPPTLHRGPDEPRYFADHRRQNPLYRKGFRCNYTFRTGTEQWGAGEPDVASPRQRVPHVQCESSVLCPMCLIADHDDVVTLRPSLGWIDVLVEFLDEREDVSLLLDRKSTRLNSSHLVISYAVFCLKKK